MIRSAPLKRHIIIPSLTQHKVFSTPLFDHQFKETHSKNKVTPVDCQALCTWFCYITSVFSSAYKKIFQPSFTTQAISPQHLVLQTSTLLAKPKIEFCTAFHHYTCIVSLFRRIGTPKIQFTAVNMSTNSNATEDVPTLGATGLPFDLILMIANQVSHRARGR